MQTLLLRVKGPGYFFCSAFANGMKTNFSSNDFQLGTGAAIALQRKKCKWLCPKVGLPLSSEEKTYSVVTE
jgi:hypothetical protein